MTAPSISGVTRWLRRAARFLDADATTGQGYGINVFTPIVNGREDALRRVLDELPPGADSPLARLPQLHCSRLHIISELVYQGGGQKRDTLNSAYLVFTASFDGDDDCFLGDICTRLPEAADEIWGHCVAYPGTEDPTAFKRWMRHNQVANHYVLTPYPSSTVHDVHSALDLRARLGEFAQSSQGLDPSVLQERFRQAFGGGADGS